jgi:hypothetical protein
LITGRVTVTDHLDEFVAGLEIKVQAALASSATVMASVANRESTKINVTWNPTRVVGTHDGFRVGIVASNPLWRIFDKGSLGKRKTQLKGRNRRKGSWQVVQRHRSYVAHRHVEVLSDTSKGVSALDITNPARRIGRQNLINEIRR